MPTVDIDRDAAHDAAQRELAAPIYPRPSLLERLTDWLDDQFYRLALKSSTVPGGWITVLVLTILVVVAVVVAVRLARRTMRTNRSPGPGLFGGTELSAAEHRSAAARYAAQEDWAAAIRHRLRAVGRHLEEAGVLTAVPGRTAGELASAGAAEIPALSAEFTAAAAVFNDVTYGEQPGTASGDAVVAALDDHLRTRVPSSAPAAASATAGDGWAQVR